MSAALDSPSNQTFWPLRESDLDEVMEIEIRAYPFPWTRGVFNDCLRAHYPGWVLREKGKIVGYAVITLAMGEAHILNICIAPEFQSRGYGRTLLRLLVQQVHDRGGERIFLEVRLSNGHAQVLYHSEGFNEIGRRPRYYPAHHGREDAVVMAMELLGEAS
ncbi:MAG: ribosomal protein S18-alanine N-acetyltransferase [Xanthomonadaceae bacterium]|jgi:ribosomal-protein-alanine N-acetyltransferase|nr:ribosomal protein S18-alanine N-acetyltransferase [Xanthomonadaceae bacterium]